MAFLSVTVFAAQGADLSNGSWGLDSSSSGLAAQRPQGPGNFNLIFQEREHLQHACSQLQAQVPMLRWQSLLCNPQLTVQQAHGKMSLNHHARSGYSAMDRRPKLTWHYGHVADHG